MSTQDNNQYVLTPEQFAFMQRFDILFRINSYEWWVTKKNNVIFDLLIQSETFKNLFGDMGMDDLLDRYSSTKGYEISPFGEDLINVIGDEYKHYLPSLPPSKGPWISDEEFRRELNLYRSNSDTDE